MSLRKLSIRTLLVSVTVIALSLAWVASNRRTSQLERSAILEIKSRYNGFELIERSTPMLCGVGVSGIADRNPTNLVNRFFGDWWPETFDRVTHVYINGLRYDNEVLLIIDKFRNLREVEINETSCSAIAIDEFKKSNPHIEVTVVQSIFKVTAEEGTLQHIEQQFQLNRLW